MAIRWDEFPHREIRLKIYARLAPNDVARSAEDSLRHVLRLKLPSLDTEDHKRFVELEARSLVEHLRSTRDVYWEFVNSKGCRPVLDAKWVVLRCAVLPTALAVLREKVIDYAKLTRVPGRDLSLLFGILTRTCYRDSVDVIALHRLPDLEDETAATDDELQSLGDLVNEDSLLWFSDIRDGGAVGRPFGGGPFSTDDLCSIRRSFEMCGLIGGITLPEWVTLREKIWNLRAPWTEGLCSLFGTVQEELMSQWHALPSDSLVHELKLVEQDSGPRSIVVPSMKPADEAEKRRPGRKPRLPQEFGVCAGKLWRKASFNNPTQVSDDRLQQIAAALDAAGHLPPVLTSKASLHKNLRLSTAATRIQRPALSRRGHNWSPSETKIIFAGCVVCFPVVPRNQTMVICPEINSGQEMSSYLLPSRTAEFGNCRRPLMFLGQRGPSPRMSIEA